MNKLVTIVVLLALLSVSLTMLIRTKMDLSRMAGRLDAMSSRGSNIPSRAASSVRSSAYTYAFRITLIMISIILLVALGAVILQ